jgi:tetraacyldisaccharide 4'-kinase
MRMPYWTKYCSKQDNYCFLQKVNGIGRDAGVPGIFFLLAPCSLCYSVGRMDKIPAALAPIAYLPGLLFEAIVRIRNRMYSNAVLQIHQLPGPVISIGNLTMGGTGKTPLVIYTAQMLAQLGYKPAVLTRGYGRPHPEWSHIVSPTRPCTANAALLGDEPALILRHVPSILMGVSKDRVCAGSSIGAENPGAVFILDDGFQHRQLHRDIDIVIIDASQPLLANHLFPRGTLREPVSSLRRSDIIVVNNMLTPGTADSVETQIRRLHPTATIFHCVQRIESLVEFNSWKERRTITNPPKSGQSTFLVTGLGNPERFRRDIQQLDIEVRGTRFFDDHYRLLPNDWQDCIREARLKKAGALVTTEKDAVKIDQSPDFPLLVAVQKTVFPDEKGFALILQKTVEGRL